MGSSLEAGVADGRRSDASAAASATLTRASDGQPPATFVEQLELATSLWAKFMGLMGRPSLPAGHGLWLSGTNGIHMMFMRFPIDAVFLGRAAADGSRAVVGVKPRLRRWIGVVWYVRGADSVIELPVGTIDETGIEVGDSVRLNGVP
jgi:uncharacterized membrane protein (UPF0127 family)